MGIKIVPPDNPAQAFSKAWKRWSKGEPTPPKGMSKFAVDVAKGKFKGPGRKPTPPKPKRSAEPTDARTLGPETISLAIGGPIESPLEEKQKPLYEEELGMYGGGAIRKKMYARGGGTRSTRG